MSVDLNIQKTEIVKDAPVDNKKESKSLKKLGFKNHNELAKGIVEFQMKYYNIFGFLFLPLYAFISFLVFRKPYNYGEQLIINTYLQSVTTFLSLLLFVFSLVTQINVLGKGIVILPFLYYSYVYIKLYKLTFGQFLVKTLKFLGVFLGVMALFIIIGAVFAFIYLKATK